MSNKTLLLVAFALIMILIALLCVNQGLYLAYMMFLGGAVPTLTLLAVVTTIFAFRAKRGRSATPLWAIIFVLEATALLMGLVGWVSNNETELFAAYCILLSFTAYTILQIFLGIVAIGIFGTEDQTKEGEGDELQKSR